MLTHSYPGNIRELENLIERAVVMAQGDTILPQHIVFSHSPAAGSTAGPIDVEAAVRRGQSLDDLLAGIERRALQFALREANGDRAEAARLLGISEDTLTRKLEQHDMGGR